MDRMDRARRRFAIALAAMAGFIDAVGFLSADGYFVSFMSGNTTRLGVALGTDVPRAAMPALLIGGFVAGVTLGALAALKAGTRRKLAVLALVALCLLEAAGARAVGLHGAMLAGLVLAMGALNNTFLRDGEVAVGLTYMTGALVKLGQGLAREIAGTRAEWRPWALLWAGLLAGAVVGAFLQDRLPLGCLWIGAAWAMIMAAVAVRLPAEA
nr:YoaK family protein [Novosphingobium sp. SG720]